MRRSSHHSIFQSLAYIVMLDYLPHSNLLQDFSNILTPKDETFEAHT